MFVPLLLLCMSLCHVTFFVLFARGSTFIGIPFCITLSLEIKSFQFNEKKLNWRPGTYKLGDLKIDCMS